MKSIAPIIGHETGVGNLLKKRVERLLHERGFTPNWVDDGSFAEVLNYTPLSTWIPITIDIYAEDNWEEHSDIVLPLIERFSTTRLILSKPSLLAKQIYELPDEVSLWRKRSVPDPVRLAIKYIYLHLDNVNLAIADICTSVIQTKDTLERKFENWNGRSIWKFVELMRLHEACRLLEETKATVSEIADSLGYGDNTSFDRSFKKEFLVSPSAFRQNVKLSRQNAK